MYRIFPKKPAKSDEKQAFSPSNMNGLLTIPVKMNKYVGGLVLGKGEISVCRGEGTRHQALVYKEGLRP